MTDVFLHTSRQPVRTCPTCGATHNAATGISGDNERPVPEAGDITMCAECLTMLVFTDDGYRLAEESDLALLDPEMRELITALQHRRRA